jgi:hypothetical protein
VWHCQSIICSKQEVRIREEEHKESKRANYKDEGGEKDRKKMNGKKTKTKSVFFYAIPVFHDLKQAPFHSCAFL